MNSNFSKSNFNKLSKISTNLFSRTTVNGRFILCSLKQQHHDFDLYKGIDISSHKWVHIYLKTKSRNQPFNKINTEVSMSQIFPSVLEAGQTDILKQKYYYEVHQIYGPNFVSIFKKIKQPPKPRQLLHLLLELFKLIEKIDHLRLVSGQLVPQLLLFDPSPRKNDLYLMNCFALKKKNQQKEILKNKYSSRGVHLGLKISIKDDLESICYILIDIFTSGAFLSSKQPYEYQQKKLSLKIEKFAQDLPKPFIDFYNFVINLNYNDQVDYYYWRKYLISIITPEVTYKPYGFLMAKNETNQTLATKDEVDTNEEEDLMEMLEEEGHSKSANLSKVNREIPNNSKLK